MGLSFRSAEERAQFAERLAQGRDEDASREEQRTANRDFRRSTLRAGLASVRY